jgi:ketosteroid isomerase-like protein
LAKVITAIDTEEILTRYIDAFSRRDIDEVMALCAPDILHIHPFPQPVKGVKAVREENEAFFKAFPDLRVDLGRIITKGTWVQLSLSSKEHKQGNLKAQLEQYRPQTSVLNIKLEASGV